VVLAERGSHLDGEYRVVQVRPGVTRIPVLWTRLRTPNGVTVDLDSPGVDRSKVVTVVRLKLSLRH